MQTSLAHLVRPTLTLTALPPQVQQSKPVDKERSYKCWLKTQASNLWRRELLQESSPTSPPSRMKAYILLNQPDLYRNSLYRPAPYVYSKNSYLLNLCRLRVQGWTQLLPTHLHYTTSRTRAPYEDRQRPIAPTTTNLAMKPTCSSHAQHFIPSAKN